LAPDLNDSEPSRGRPTRRAALTALGLIPLAACGTGSQLADSARTFRDAVLGSPDLPLTRAQIARLPYASMRARIGNGPQGLLILARIDGPDLHWMAADYTVIVTRGGRLVRTANLPIDNLKETLFIGAPDPVREGLHRLSQGHAYVERHIDFEKDRRYGMPIVSDFRIARRERLNILEIDFDCVLVEERNQARAMNWSFENRYWASVGNGFVWRSVQHIAKGMPPITMEILKAPA